MSGSFSFAIKAIIFGISMGRLARGLHSQRDENVSKLFPEQSYPAPAERQK